MIKNDHLFYINEILNNIDYLIIAHDKNGNVIYSNPVAKNTLLDSQIEQLNNFIKTNYPFVTFPIFEKVEVNGKNEHELFSFLKGLERRRTSDFKADGSENAKEGQNLEGQAIARISHGYEKFLIGRDGKMISRFNWQDMPLDEEPRIMGAGWTIREAIDEVLG